MKKKQAFRIDPVFVVWVVAIIAISYLSYKAVMRLMVVWPRESVEQKFTASIRREGAWFVKSQKPEGNFVYEQISATGNETENNNIVRQAAVLYGLGHIYRLNKDPEIDKTFKKGLTYFQGLTSTPGADMAAITHEDATFTNTTALLVLGLTEYLDADEAHKTTENLEYLVRLSNYLVSTQATTGAYLNTLPPNPTESDYNNGETMYALIRSYRIVQKDSYLQSVKKMAEYAMEHYGKNKFNVSFFSWSMAGFAYLYKVDPQEKYWDYMKMTTDQYYSKLGNRYEQYLKKESKIPITPGSSVFFEGIDHIGWIAKEKDPALYKKLQSHAKRVLEHLLIFEINSSYGKYASKDDRVSGAVCATVDCQTTRIDFMQHNTSAMALYLRFFK